MWTSPPKKNPMNIIDVSHFQGMINYSEAATNNPPIDGVYIKATQGVGYTDSMLKYNANEATKAGFKVGYYHYASLNTPNAQLDAKQEAHFFIDTIRKLPVFGLPLALDIEENKAHLTDLAVQLWVTTFFAELVALGYKDYVIYSYTPFLNSNLPASHSLGDIRLWLAAYTNKAQPELPHGWDKYFLWQYTAKGRINGCKTDIDINRSNPASL